MADDVETIREALRFGRPVGMGSNDDALEALERLAEENAAKDAENLYLRRLLFAAHAGALGYGDDGEMHDATKFPIIDWKRDSVEQIERALLERAARALVREEGSGDG